MKGKKRNYNDSLCTYILFGGSQDVFPSPSFSYGPQRDQTWSEAERKEKNNNM